MLFLPLQVGGGGGEWEDKVGGEKRGKCEETGEFKGAEVSEN